MFPQLFDPVKLRKGIDSFVDGIVTDYGDSLGALSDHFERWLGWFEKLLRTAPWWSVVLTVIVVAWLLTRPSRQSGTRLAAGTAIASGPACLR